MQHLYELERFLKLCLREILPVLNNVYGKVEFFTVLLHIVTYFHLIFSLRQKIPTQSKRRSSGQINKKVLFRFRSARTSDSTSKKETFPLSVFRRHLTLIETSPRKKIDARFLKNRD